MFSESHRNSPLYIEKQLFSLIPIGGIVALAVVLMVAVQAAPAEWRLHLRYDRAAVAAGELWRLVTGNFVHLSWTHLTLNLAGLLLGTWLFGADRRPAQWVLAAAVSAVAVNAGLFLLTPSVHWCVGLSGLLHGLMVVGFGGWVLQGDRMAGWLLGVVLAKLMWEQLGGEMPWTEELAGGMVVTDAHLWGAVGGALYLSTAAFWQGFRAQV
jgi:rhomboid family GlyGly-CTERM serine protease